MVVYSSDPSTWKVETKRSGVQGHPQLQGEFKDNLSYMRTYLNKYKRDRNEGKEGGRKERNFGMSN